MRASDGRTLVPLGALVSLDENAAAPSLRRFDRLPSIQLSAALAPGYDLGSALADLEAAAAERLPPEARIGYERAEPDLQGPRRRARGWSSGWRC